MLYIETNFWIYATIVTFQSHKKERNIRVINTHWFSIVVHFNHIRKEWNGWKFWNDEKLGIGIEIIYWLLMDNKWVQVRNIWKWVWNNSF